MPRIRTIKPNFFRSKSVARLSYRARLTWQGLWTYVDDEGRGTDDPRDIKGQIWSQDDDVTWLEVVADMDELAAGGKIIRYTVRGEEFFYIPNWREHQRISKPTPSTLPEPTEPEEDVPAPLPEDSRNATGGLPLGREGKGKELGREGSAAGAPPSMFCSSHPNGTERPCRACGNARRTYDAWKPAPATTPLPPRKADLCERHEWNRRENCIDCAAEKRASA